MLIKKISFQKKALLKKTLCFKFIYWPYISYLIDFIKIITNFNLGFIKMLIKNKKKYFFKLHFASD